MGEGHRKDDDLYTKDGTVDYQGNPAKKNETGTWKACPFILGFLLLNFPFFFESLILESLLLFHVFCCFSD